MGAVTRLRDPAVPVRPLLHACSPERTATCLDGSHTGSSLLLSCLRVGPRRTKRPAIPVVDCTASTPRPPWLTIARHLDQLAQCLGGGDVDVTPMVVVDSHPAIPTGHLSEVVSCANTAETRYFWFCPTAWSCSLACWLGVLVDDGSRRQQWVRVEDFGRCSRPEKPLLLR